MTEDEARAAVVAEVRKWKRTPYHHNQAVMGAGVDCGRVIIEAFVGAGLIERPDVGRYTHDWHLHRSDEKYLSVVERYMSWVDGTEAPLRERTDHLARPGDVLVWKVGRTYSHGAIVTAWPYIVHSSLPDRSVVEVNIFGTVMAEKPMRTYSYWGGAA